MDYARLGRSGLKVSRICLGTNMFGAGYVDDKRAIAVINEAREQGVNFIDTADAYHSGLSEQVVGKAVKDHRHEFVIGTKGFMPTGPGINDKGLSRKHVIEAVDLSLRHLDTDYIDHYQVHFWDPETPLEETLRALDDMVRQGKIRYIGCSNFAAWQLCRALWISDKHGLERFESVQPDYNFGRRHIETELFPLCTEQQVSVIPFQVLMGGLLTGNYDHAKEPPGDSHLASKHAGGAKKRYWNESHFGMVDRLKSIATKTGHSPTQLALAWALSKPVVTSVIVGASRPEHVVHNAQAVEIKLAPDVLEQLDSIE